MKVLTILLMLSQQAALWSVLLAKHYSGDQIKKNEMDGVHSMYEGQKRCIYGLGGETWGNKATWKTQA